MSTINGTAGNDTLVGDKFPFHLPPFLSNADTINGFDGDDKLYGLSQNDTLNGGNGNDQLFGGSGNDTLRGNNGVDVLDGGTGADNMNGGDQNDTYIVDNIGDIAAESFNDALGGVDLVQSSVSHTLGFGIENLTLTGVGNINGTGNGNNNIINGNSGNNTLSGLAGNDTLRGNNGNDFLNGGTGADNMNGGDQNDTYIVDNIGDIAVESFNDALGGVDLVQSSVNHTLGFGIENLTLTGAAAINGTGNGNANVITGNAANNVLSGLDGNDKLHGGQGNDTLNGGNGRDLLNGSVGNDILNGGNGDDLMYGGDGADVQNGGLGADLFIFDGLSESPAGAGLRDTIIGFNGAAGDVIDLIDVDANLLVGGNQTFKWIGSSAFTGAGQLRYSGGVLKGNVDSDSTPEFEIALVGAPALVVGGAGTDILL
ncbi:MAG: calcium-binding protein [Nitrospira sp.]|nr:calcium-binding protein [Nitrospira sp.]